MQAVVTVVQEDTQYIQRMEEELYQELEYQIDGVTILHNVVGQVMHRYLITSFRMLKDRSKLRRLQINEISTSMLFFREKYLLRRLRQTMDAFKSRSERSIILLLSLDQIQRCHSRKLLNHSLTLLQTYNQQLYSESSFNLLARTADRIRNRFQLSFLKVIKQRTKLSKVLHRLYHILQTTYLRVKQEGLQFLQQNYLDSRNYQHDLIAKLVKAYDSSRVRQLRKVWHIFSTEIDLSHRKATFMLLIQSFNLMAEKRQKHALTLLSRAFSNRKRVREGILVCYSVLKKTMGHAFFIVKWFSRDVRQTLIRSVISRQEINSQIEEYKKTAGQILKQERNAVAIKSLIKTFKSMKKRQKEYAFHLISSCAQTKRLRSCCLQQALVKFQKKLYSSLKASFFSRMRQMNTAVLRLKQLEKFLQSKFYSFKLQCYRELQLRVLTCSLQNEVRSQKLSLSIKKIQQSNWYRQGTKDIFSFYKAWKQKVNNTSYISKASLILIRRILLKRMGDAFRTIAGHKLRRNSSAAAGLLLLNRTLGRWIRSVKSSFIALLASEPVPAHLNTQTEQDLIQDSVLFKNSINSTQLCWPEDQQPLQPASLALSAPLPRVSLFSSPAMIFSVTEKMSSPFPRVELFPAEPARCPFPIWDFSQIHCDQSFQSKTSIQTKQSSKINLEEDYCPFRLRVYKCEFDDSAPTGKAEPKARTSNLPWFRTAHNAPPMRKSMTRRGFMQRQGSKPIIGPQFEDRLGLRRNISCEREVNKLELKHSGSLQHIESRKKSIQREWLARRSIGLDWMQPSSVEITPDFNRARHAQSRQKMKPQQLFSDEWTRQPPRAFGKREPPRTNRPLAPMAAAGFMNYLMHRKLAAPVPIIQPQISINITNIVPAQYPGHSFRQPPQGYRLFRHPQFEFQ